MKIYTRKGDDGTTGLLFGGRVAKDAPGPRAYGVVDEAQASMGLARAMSEPGSELDGMLVSLERDLWVLMAELATDPSNHHKLEAGKNQVTEEMVESLEKLIDDVSGRFDPPTEFVVPGEDLVSAQLDVARTVVRRAEREVVGLDGAGPQVVTYLNRLSDLLWTLARWQEGDSLATREVGR